jgi:hypothetical protein
VATETADIALRLKLNSLRESLKEVPGLTRREVRKAVRAASKEWKGLKPAARKASKDAGRAVKDVNDQVKKLGEVVQGDLGGVLGRLGGVVELVGGLGAVGGPIALAVAGAAALATGFAAVNAALVSTVFLADDLLKEQQQLASVGAFDPVDPAAAASVVKVNDAVTALGKVWDRLVVDIATNIAPNIEDLSVTLVALALRAQDTFSGFLEGRNILRDFAVYLVDSFIQGLFGPIATLLDGLGLLGDALIALGAEDVGGALRGVNDAFEGMTQSAAEYVVDGIAPTVSGMLDLEGATSDYREQAEALIDATNAQRDADQRGARAREALAAAAAKAAAAYKEEQRQLDMLIGVSDEIAQIRSDVGPELEGLDAIESRYDAQIGRLRELRTTLRALGRAGFDTSADLIDAYDAVREVEEARAAEIGDFYDDIAQQRQQFALDLTFAALKTSGELFDLLAEKSKGAAIAVVVAQKAASLLQIALATATNISNAAAVFAFPSPAGVAAVAAAAALGAAQAAVVAATPVSFHSGGVAPDEMRTTVQRGEGVVSQQGMNALAKVNRGEIGGGSGDVFVQGADHRVFDGNVRASITRRNSPLRRSVARASRSRRRSPRYGTVRG